MEQYEQKGFLNSNFKIFHLKDRKLREFSYHYHAFHKLLILIRGNVTYHIDGRAYRLEPYDIVFVPAGEVHRPQIEKDCEYERIIVYISDEFINSYRNEEYDLSACFNKVKSTGSNVLRVKSLVTSRLYATICELENASAYHQEYAAALYEQVLFLEFMIQLNRAVIDDRIAYPATQAPNSKIAQIMNYIEEHLREELSIDSLAGVFYLDKYYLMHLFKEETGRTVGNYITGKRLAQADELVREGATITEACYACGFQNYSTFSRAYKKYFGCSPKDKSRQNISATYRLEE